MYRAADLSGMSDCVFCAILDGEIPSRTVHEDEDTFAFLDVNPLTRGHTLVVPKEHHERVSDLPTDTRDAVFSTLGRLAPAVERAVDADGVTIGINDGTAAGQEIPHVHGHLVPRSEGDGVGAIHSLRWPRPELDDDAFDDVQAAIRDAQ
jgi:histidine triad (HIT) family protein